MNSHRPLSPSETTAILALKIQGVQHESQLPAVKRLTNLGVPPRDVQAVALAKTSEDVRHGEDKIISWATATWNADGDRALEVLNGHQPLAAVRQCSLD
jgi:hypothetical protein